MSIKTRAEIELLANDEYKDNTHNPFFTAAPMGYIKGYSKCQDALSSRILELERQLEEANSNFRILAPIAIMHQIENDKLKTQIESVTNVTLDGILNIIEEFKVKELPNRNEPYHHEAEIEAGLNHLEIFIKEKYQSHFKSIDEEFIIDEELKDDKVLPSEEGLISSGSVSTCNLEPKVTFTTDLWVGKVKIPVRTELDFSGLHTFQHEKLLKLAYKIYNVDKHLNGL